MKAILINPFARSIEYVETELTLEVLHRLVDEDCIDICRPFPGHRFECVVVGDHSALADPPLASFSVEGYPNHLYGRAVVYRTSHDGKEYPTKLTLEEVANLIEFQ